MKVLFTFLITVLLLTQIQAQSNIIPLNSYYKDEIILNSNGKVNQSFYPVTENEIPLFKIIKDSTKVYSDFINWLYKKHWIEIKKEDATLNISPIFNFTLGKEMASDKNVENQNTFKNYRGIYVNGTFSNKLSFDLKIVENQTRLMHYESEVVKSFGEYYVNYIDDNNYSVIQQNAVIPGGARTKDLKNGGFDYSFSYGNLFYKINEKINIEAGNNPQFIGNGYRSLFLSDFSVGAPYLKFHHKISNKWSYQILYRKNKNLYRKPATNYVERPYENKFFSASYLTYKAKDNLAISLFTSNQELLQDYISKYLPTYHSLLPIPILTYKGITGLNIDFAYKNFKPYAQIAFQKSKKVDVAAQIGTYWIQPAKIKKLLFQIEANYIPVNFYSEENTKLSYSHFNLPLAHIKGNNFTEILARLSFSAGKFFCNTKANVYFSSIYKDIDNQKLLTGLLANDIRIIKNGEKTNLSEITYVQDVEIGFRINRKYNFEIFAGGKMRFNSTYNINLDEVNQHTFMFNVGMRTGLFNQYFDL